MSIHFLLLQIIFFPGHFFQVFAQRANSKLINSFDFYFGLFPYSILFPVFIWGAIVSFFKLPEEIRLVVKPGAIEYFCNGKISGD